MPKVSIIVPLYNKAPYVHKALESIIAQTFTDWECIIVDDGSTDHSQQVVEKWLTSSISGTINSSFRLIHQPNSGVSAARNRGVSLAQGDFLAFLDADDWWAPTFLEEMIQLAAAYPEAGIYASNYIYYKPGKTHVSINNIETGYFNYPRAYYESGAMPITSISVLMPRWVLCGENRVADGFPVGIKLGEDFLTWCIIAMTTKVAFLNKPLAYYNNSVPTTARATRNLHQPEAHMLWHLPEKIVGDLNEDWLKLFSQLRVTGLLPYWLSDEYRYQAKQELAKVQWDLLDDWKDKKKYQRLYQQPICVLKAEQWFMRLGSAVKQYIIRRFV